MKKNIIIYVIWMAGFLISSSLIAVALEHSGFDQKISFNGSLYPTSPLQQLRSSTMSIWSDVHGAFMSSQLLFQFDQNIDLYAEKLLDVYAMVYGLQSAQKDMLVQEDQEYFSSLYKLVSDIEVKFDGAMVGHRSDQASCCKVVLQKIQKKLERMLA